MNRTTLARRYAPLAAVVAIQLLIIAAVPSKAPNATTVATSGATAGTGGDQSIAAGDTGAGATGGATAAADSSATGSAVAVGSPGATSGGSKSAAAGAGLGGAAAGGATPAGGATEAAGDTTHCVDGRQFDPAIDYFAPPCVPKFAGKNAGATYQGVTADTIKIIHYYDAGDPAVNAILQAQGAYTSIEQDQAFLPKVQKFINDHYELYGRKVSIEIYKGTCKTIPPDVPCLRNEMDQIVKDKSPFAVVWNTSLCSACYDELSALKTVNVGGWHFRDQFSQARKPYHWDVQQSGTSLNTAFGQWWCAQMAKKPAKFAGNQNPADQINGRPRVLGVISTNDPENQGAIASLKAALTKCGDKVAHEYYYSQDISTAEQQRAEGVSKMRGTPGAGDESTTVLCSCDLVAPSFLYEEEQQENYYPENVLNGSGFMDADKVGQSYMQASDGSSSLACPSPSQGCEFDRAFGLSSISAQEPKFADAGSRVWKAAGGTGDPPFESVSATWDYYNLVATLLQAAGPNLVPPNLDAGIRKYGLRGGGDSGHIARGFPAGSYSWNQDMRIIYWNKHAKSPYEGKDGVYVQVEAGRKMLGEYDATDFNSLAIPYDR